MQPLEKAESDVQSPAAAEDGLMHHKSLLWEGSVWDDLQNWKSLIWMGEGKWTSWLSYFCNSGHVSKKSTTSETGICKWKRKSKETFSMQNFLFRNKNVNNNVTWKIIALHLNMHRNTQCPAVSTAWLLPFPLLPFVPSPFALTLYMAVMLMSSTEVSPSHLGIPSAGTEQSHRLLSLSADIKSKDHTQR